MRTDKALIVDLEATCWETREESAQNQSEIIEIGVVLYNLKTKVIEKAEGIIVKPEFSTVSEFCTKLTTLTQEDVDQGMPLAKAMSKLLRTYDARNYPWISWGDYDKNMMKRQCQRFDLKYPMSEAHTNLKVEFAHVKGIKPCGMEKALAILGIPLEGTHHRGVDDAKNITRIFEILQT